eukprot:5271917-Heterocapsa_arctica.AAC.1
MVNSANRLTSLPSPTVKLAKIASTLAGSCRQRASDASAGPTGAEGVTSHAARSIQAVAQQRVAAHA